MYSLTHSGILVAVLGLVLVQVVGITDSCSSEVTAKIVELAPVVTGGIMSWIGRYRAGGVTLGGFKTHSY